MATPEKLPSSREAPRGSVEIPRDSLAERRIERVSPDKHDKLKTDRSHEAQEAARAAVHEAREAEHISTDNTPQPAALPGKSRSAAFKNTMDEIQTHHMSKTGKLFSKLIHNKPIEAISETSAKTIARPNAILYGSLFAFIATLTTYLLAKNYGYPLSGFETIGSFIVGWIFGMVVDFVRLMILGRR